MSTERTIGKRGVAPVGKRDRHEGKGGVEEASRARARDRAAQAAAGEVIMSPKGGMIL